MKGLVIRSTGSWYDVRTDDGQLFACKVKGNFRLRGIRSTNPVAVGDRVEITPTAVPDSTPSTTPDRQAATTPDRQAATTPDGSPSGLPAFITEIHDRRNYIIRRASNLSKQSHIIAANVDLACLIVTIAHPETATTFIDRFLASAEAYRVPVALIFNKTDLYDADERRYLDAVMALYRHLNYPCFAVSAETGEGITAPTVSETSSSVKPSAPEGPLLPFLLGKTTLFSGNSGVGKSTLLNRLVPEARAKIAPLSEAHDQGQHTTTFSEMYDLPMVGSEGTLNPPPSTLNPPPSTLNPQPSTLNRPPWGTTGGAIIDTPGIRGFGTFDFGREEVSHYFREIFAIGRDCRFSNCTHTHEPGCAVLQALDNHEIAESRYRSYLSMLEDEDESKYREKF